MCFPDRTFVHGIYGQKLISYGHLEGEAGLERGKNGERVTKIVNLVCASADTTATDRYQPDVCLDGLLCHAIFPFYAAIGTQALSSVLFWQGLQNAVLSKLKLDSDR